ncbi:isoprenylcysteine carboxylmethyltransferase family protein [Allorhizobium sp. BGMRC 0089]|uniref:methyltransferase family protein n=1 Tax=Allorhizobium sonneratiae TaxID=2934936 RepID=UPI0020332050|nr:isoprenylcysteine carboxylmethyltransferase family protein [Allorhizobium sonneratiae]MCM2293587.1 isoprenylcysteine carboxylmethyltransferase family protein [Allorhizobium sonneratiae]
MNAYRLKPLKYPWPPLLYFGACVCALCLHIYITPARLFDNQSLVVMMGGALTAAIGLSLSLWAIRTLLVYDTTLSPRRSALRLVTDGPYRYSRNPIYLGYTLLMMAAGLLSGNGWLIIAAPVAAALTTLIAIRCEEMHLLVRFGVDFERYCQRTRRWL